MHLCQSLHDREVSIGEYKAQGVQGESEDNGYVFWMDKFYEVSRHLLYNTYLHCPQRHI
jgi:hypothetical protein